VHQFGEVFAPSFISPTISCKGIFAYAKLARDKRDHRSRRRLAGGENPARIPEVE